MRILCKVSSEVGSSLLTLYFLFYLSRSHENAICICEIASHLHSCWHSLLQAGMLQSSPVQFGLQVQVPVFGLHLPLPLLQLFGHRGTLQSSPCQFRRQRHRPVLPLQIRFPWIFRRVSFCFHRDFYLPVQAGMHFFLAQLKPVNWFQQLQVPVFSSHSPWPKHNFAGSSFTRVANFVS